MDAENAKGDQSKRLRVREATTDDLDPLTCLINAAFVVEHVVFDGDRVDINEMRTYMATGTFLLAESVDGIAGCVYVEVRGERAYLGLLSVQPSQQGLGLGRQLVRVAEDFARAQDCQVMDLRVISARSELLPFYERLGYQFLRTEPFPANLPAKMPSHFIHLFKPLV